MLFLPSFALPLRSPTPWLWRGNFLPTFAFPYRHPTLWLWWRIFLFPFLFLLFPLSSFTQSFLTQQYNAKQFNTHELMWDAKTDAQGRIWFANNQGVVRFDGSNWRLFSTSFQVRGLAFSPGHNLYLAGSSDFGWMRMNPNGEFTFESLRKKLPENYQKTGGSEQVFSCGNSMVFSCFNYLVEFETDRAEPKVTLHAISNVLGAFAFGDKLFAVTAGAGLARIQKGNTTVVLDGGLMLGKRIAASCTLEKGVLIACSSGELFFFDGSRLKPASGDLTLFAKKGLVSLTKNTGKTEWIAAGSLHNGVELFGPNLEQISKPNLPNQEMYLVFCDRENNLWSAHGAGLTQTLLASEARSLSSLRWSGKMSDMQLHNNHLFLASTGGLFRSAGGTEVCTNAGNIRAECWDLEVWRNQLFVASTDGCFAGDGNSFKLFLPGETILRIQPGIDKKELFLLGETGVWKITGDGEPTRLPDLPGYCNTLVRDEAGTWYAGTFAEGLQTVPASARPKLPESLAQGEVQIRVFRGQIFFQKGLEVYQKDGQPATSDVQEILGGIRNKEQQIMADALLFTDQEIRLLENEKRIAASPVHLLGGKTFAACRQQNICRIANEEGIFVASAQGKTGPAPIASVSYLSYGKGKTAFAGIFSDGSGNPLEKQEEVPGIDYEESPVTLEFGSGSFLNPAQNRYSYRIKEEDEAWSDWSSMATAQLSRLKGGTYDLELKVKNAAGTESEPVLFRFFIRVPWYLSGQAYLAYFLILILLVYLVVWLNQRRLQSKNRQLEAKVAERTRELQEEKSKSDGLLLNILPAEVAEELKNTGGLQARQFKNVSILFTDFIGFTSISEQLSPQGLVEEIHYCFKNYDEIVEQNKLEKIKTVGDAYIAVCGMPLPDPDHAAHVAQAALDIREFMRTYQEERKAEGKPFFEVRIGINSGPVIAGIVGNKKFAYDIWGDTVNTAARMEQNCEPGGINISGATYEFLKNQFKCSYRGKVEAKNKGRIDMYYVTDAL